jgi:hypothetical protein
MSDLDIDRQLRDEANRWRRDSPPTPDLATFITEPAARPARPRRMRARTTLIILATAACVAALAIGLTALSRHSGNSRINAADVQTAKQIALREATTTAQTGATRNRNGWPSSLTSAAVIETDSDGVRNYAGDPTNFAVPHRALIIRLAGVFNVNVGGAGCPAQGPCQVANEVTAITFIVDATSKKVVNTSVTTRAPAPTLSNATYLFRR